MVPSKGAFFNLTGWEKETWRASRITIIAPPHHPKHLNYSFLFVLPNGDPSCAFEFFDLKSFIPDDR